MANIKSQIKRIKTNEKRRTREAIAAGDREKAEEALRLAGRKLDKAVSKGVIHKNQAANRQSKLAKQIQKMEQA